MPKTAKSVLFVCLGNICRSPAAEGVFHRLVQQHGLGAQINVDSAGTAGYHVGKPADPRMLAAAARRGIELTSRARVVLPSDFQKFDLIVAMDQDNYNELSALTDDGPHPRLRLLSDYLDESWPRNVPDPYYGGSDGFEYVLDMLEAACPKILEAVVGGSKSPSP